MIPTGKPKRRIPYLVYTDTGWDRHSYEEAFVVRMGYYPDHVFRHNGQIWIGPVEDPDDFPTNIPADADV